MTEEKFAEIITRQGEIIHLLQIVGALATSILVISSVYLVIALSKMLAIARLSQKMELTMTVVEQHTTIVQQYADLLAREEREIVDEVRAATIKLQDTVRDAGDSGSHPAVPMSPEQRAKAQERHNRATKEM